MINWHESYSTGIEELDRQHQDLFLYTNNLGEVIADDAVSQSIMNKTLQLLNRYVSVHFSHEETCMHRHHCPIARTNKDAHLKFIATFKEIEKKILENPDSDDPAKELHHFLETWLVQHICKIDTQLKSCISH